MTPQATRPRHAAWLALLAMALLTFAGVRSTVMQASMSRPGACAEMAGMAMDHTAGRHGGSAPAKSAPCEFCAAAAHVAVESTGVRLVPPRSAVTFARYAAPASSGPRGPPFRAPTARGPPERLSA